MIKDILIKIANERKTQPTVIEPPKTPIERKMW
jgi:hypothetical protein